MRTCFFLISAVTSGTKHALVRWFANFDLRSDKMDVVKAKAVPDAMGIATRLAGFLASTFATITLMVMLVA